MSHELEDRNPDAKVHQRRSKYTDGPRQHANHVAGRNDDRWRVLAIARYNGLRRPVLLTLLSRQGLPWILEERLDNAGHCVKLHDGLAILVFASHCMDTLKRAFSESDAMQEER